MKKFLLLCFFCGVVTSVPLLSQGKWYRLGAPVNQELFKVAFLDSLTGFAAGDSGTFIKTVNGGISWAQVPLGINYPIYELFFVNKTHGWAAAWKETMPFGTVLLKTTDGGNNWVIRDYPENFVFIESIHFFDTLNGVMGGLYGYFARSTDGGNTWRKSYVDTTSFAYFPVIDFTFKNKQYGFAYGGHIDIAGVIWNTADSGKTWFGVPASPEPIRGMLYVDDLYIVAVGGDFEYGTSVIKSFNGGADWEYVTLEQMGIAMTLRARNNQEYWAPLSFARRFLVTYDQGRNWSILNTPDSSVIFDIQFLDSTLGYGVGPFGEIIKYSKSPVSGISLQQPQKNLKKTIVYPHPIAEQAMIIPAEQRVEYRFTLFTLSGEEVIIPECIRNAEGYLLRRPKTIAGGVYLLKIEWQGGVELKTLIFR